MDVLGTILAFIGDIVTKLKVTRRKVDVEHAPR